MKKIALGFLSVSFYMFVSVVLLLLLGVDVTLRLFIVLLLASILLERLFYKMEL